MEHKEKEKKKKKEWMEGKKEESKKRKYEIYTSHQLKEVNEIIKVLYC